MSKKDQFESKVNQDERKEVIIVHNKRTYKANLNLTRQYLGSLTYLDLKFAEDSYELVYATDVEISSFKAIEKYLKDEGFFDC